MKESKIRQKQSRAKKIKILLKAYEKKFLKDYQDMANFKEPVVFLMRNTRKVEFYDECTTGWFQYVHTSGVTRKVKLGPEFLHTFDYGKRTFKGYILQEDHPTPLPENPVVTGEQFEWAINKTQQDTLDHKSKELRATGDMWWKIGMGVAMIIGVLIIGKLLVPDLFSFGTKEVVTTVVQTGEAVARNVSLNP